jgi:heat shock protein HtpX
VALAIAIVTNLVAYWFSDKFVLAMYRATPVSEAEAPELHRIVRNLARKAGIPMPRIYRIDHPTPNTFATGRAAGRPHVWETDHALSVDGLSGAGGHELAVPGVPRHLVVGHGILPH